MGEDLTEEFLISQQPEQEQEKEEQKEVKTGEALKPLANVIDRGTAFFLNKVIETVGQKYEVQVSEMDRIKPEEIEELGWGEAVVKVIDYYFPAVPADHPLLGLAAAGTMLGAIAWMKIESIKAKAKEEKEEKETNSSKEESGELNITENLSNKEFDADAFYVGRG